eukprot:5847918-Lingulodinium_polyedra.AAC.1
MLRVRSNLAFSTSIVRVPRNGLGCLRLCNVWLIYTAFQSVSISLTQPHSVSLSLAQSHSVSLSLTQSHSASLNLTQSHS